jgi:hypothetical protein
MEDWTRQDFLAYADRLLEGARPWASENFARITPPGVPGGYGRDVDGLEGFARTFLLAGFRIAGVRGEGVDHLIRDYSRGIAAGVDPEAPDRWVRPDEHDQAKVEAASIALILDLTREWIWNRLDATTQGRVIDYLSPIVGDQGYPRNNWLWFRIVVQTFLRSVGGPWSAQDIADDLALHETFVREDGWLSDGDERSYDHYVGWALHLYPVLWSRMQGAQDLAAARTATDVARLARYLEDAIALVGEDGSPLIQGRSLVYRFAAAAAFWVGALAEVDTVSLGRLRRAASGIVSHFAHHGVPNSDGLLDLGWHGAWRRLAQNYSGTGSAYWAAKGLLGIALPEDHPVWSAPTEPLPSEASGPDPQDTLRVVASPGWIISTTVRDGIARVINHGTDHAREGDQVGDSPLYARLGYSTATAPLHNGDAWQEPLDQSAALLDADGRAAHRAGMRLHTVRSLDEAAVASSTATAHWIAPDAVQTRHGSGITGTVTPAATVDMISVVRGAWEIRLVRIHSDVVPEATALRIGGWPIAAERPDVETTAGSARVGMRGLASTAVGLCGEGAAGVEVRRDASPLGPVAAVPTLTYRPTPGAWIAAGIHLSGLAPEALPTLSLDGHDATVTWPDGSPTHVDLDVVLAD